MLSWDPSLRKEFNLQIVIMLNVSDVYMNHTVLLFKDEVEPKDQQAKNETVDQQVQTGETVLHIIMLLLTI